MFETELVVDVFFIMKILVGPWLAFIVIIAFEVLLVTLPKVGGIWVIAVGTLPSEHNILASESLTVIGSNSLYRA
jgi:hypothetical protein